MEGNARTAKSYDAIPLVSFPGDSALGPGLPGFIARMALEHGPIFRSVVKILSMQSVELLYLVGPEANRFVFQSHRDCFSHDLGWTPIIGESLGHGLLNMDPPEHTRHRTMMNPAFTSAYMASYLPVMQRVIEDRTRSWPDRDDVDLFEEAREITFDVAAAALVGFHTGEQVDRLRSLFYEVLHGFEPEQETWDEFVRRRLRIRDELTQLLLPLIAARRKATTEGRSPDVLGMIVQARDERGEALSDEQVLAHVNILLVAGHETTTTMGAWVLYLLATHPEYLARVHGELDATLGSRDTSVTFEAIRATPVLGNAISEAGRLHSPVATLPRGVVKEFEFGGYTVPVGTPVRLAIAAGHRLPQIFQDPDRFDPDRFAPPRDEEKRTPYALVPFGGGPRICIGINFAQIEVKALAAHVLRAYQLEPVAGRPVEPVSGITMFLPGGIHVRVRRRG